MKTLLTFLVLTNFLCAPAIAGVTLHLRSVIDPATTRPAATQPVTHLTRNLPAGAPQFNLYIIAVPDHDFGAFVQLNNHTVNCSGKVVTTGASTYRIHIKFFDKDDAGSVTSVETTVDLTPNNPCPLAAMMVDGKTETLELTVKSE